MVIAKKKVTAAKSVKKPVTPDLQKISGVISPSLWLLSTRIEDCSYELAGVSDLIGLYAESDGCMPRAEVLWLACREIERIEGRLITLADEVMNYKAPK
jgi:hypothetical protein